MSLTWIVKLQLATEGNIQMSIVSLFSITLLTNITTNRTACSESD